VVLELGHETGGPLVLILDTRIVDSHDFQWL
jgi:hypothetical protein